MKDGCYDIHFTFFFRGLFTGQDPTRRSRQEVLKTSRVGSSGVGSSGDGSSGDGSIGAGSSGDGSGRVGLGWVQWDRVQWGRDGSGRVGSEGVEISWAGSGRTTLTRPDL